LAAERERIAQEESVVRGEAQEELDRIIAEIDKLEEKREALEAFLGIKDPNLRLEHGRIRDLCFGILSRHPDGLTNEAPPQTDETC
jgi:hypothetical protein